MHFCVFHCIEYVYFTVHIIVYFAVHIIVYFAVHILQHVAVYITVSFIIDCQIFTV